MEVRDKGQSRMCCRQMGLSRLMLGQARSRKARRMTRLRTTSWQMRAQTRMRCAHPGAACCVLAPVHLPWHGRLGP